MVIAHHLIWVGYGWWLPNDPRGSMSRVIRNDVIAELGKLHHGRKKIQPASRDIRKFYEQAALLLKFPLIEFADIERSKIGEGFSDAIRANGYTCYACAIMPDHVHMLIRKHRHLAEEMIANLQAESRRRMLDTDGQQANHPIWGGPGWKVYEDTPEDVRRTIRYIEKNPIPYRLPLQHWDFVIPYDGWTPARVRIVPRPDP